MSVLLFVPESGGSPLESVIMTTDENQDSRFEYKDGKPVRKNSSDTGSVGLSGYASDTDGECSVSEAETPGDSELPLSQPLPLQRKRTGSSNMSRSTLPPPRTPTDKSLSSSSSPKRGNLSRAASGDSFFHARVHHRTHERRAQKKGDAAKKEPPTRHVSRVHSGVLV
eukprot:Nitzschia sp. Nitz4//scaffold186_size43309//4309//4812//NITZ4_007314-RA/size43309-processed-gene-0.25-mRNA-1//1//CDS//3329539749//860//frame0